MSVSTGHVLSREAGRDLEEIEDSTARRWGDAPVEKYLRDIFAAFSRLAADPGIGRRREDIPEPYLVYTVGSHLIVYRHNQSKARIEILNILHPAMNLAHRMRQAMEFMTLRKRP